MAMNYLAQAFLEALESCSIIQWLCAWVSQGPASCLELPEQMEEEVEGVHESP